jgi:hypothetical protein
MRKSRTDYLKALYTLKYATITNLAFITSIDNCYRVLKRMEAKGIVRRVHQYALAGNLPKIKQHVIWAITPKGCDHIGRDPIRIIEKSFSKFSHDTQLVDALSFFYWHYGDQYQIDIEFEPLYELKDKSVYKPDAVVKMEHWKTGNRLDFIVEYERTKAVADILKYKIAKNQQMQDFDKYGLIKKTKILYVIGEEHGSKEKEERLYNSLMERIKDLPGWYLFAKYHDFKDFHKGVWKTPQGNNVSLINQ